MLSRRRPKLYYTRPSSSGLAAVVSGPKGLYLSLLFLLQQSADMMYSTSQNHMIKQTLLSLLTTFGSWRARDTLTDSTKSCGARGISTLQQHRQQQAATNALRAGVLLHEYGDQSTHYFHHLHRQR